MRVLFFTAAAVAACLANIGQAVKLDSQYVGPDGEYSQLDTFQTAPATGGTATPAA
jgi:hypothetical protein